MLLLQILIIIVIIKYYIFFIILASAQNNKVKSHNDPMWVTNPNLVKKKKIHLGELSLQIRIFNYKTNFLIRCIKKYTYIETDIFLIYELSLFISVFHLKKVTILSKPIILLVS